MKKLLSTLLFITIALTSCSENDVMIKLDAIPQKAQLFITEHFSSYEIRYIIQDNEISGVEYEVKFTNGDDINFDSNGDWESIDCEYSQVPDSAVPQKILEYVKTNFPTDIILSIEIDRNQYEVELKSDIDLIFNKDFEFISID